MAIQKVAVLGATGQQGGGVAAALAALGSAGSMEIVALTRNPESDAAQTLAQAPHTTVQKADLNDVPSLIAAFEGCDGAFVMANFWEGMSVDVEMQQYKNVAEALKKTPTMQHIVFSTLEETVLPGVTDDFKVLHEHKETGKMYVPHFDGKARAEKYFEGLPVTFMVTSCYLDNFTSFFSFVPNEDGSYTFTLPIGEKPIPWTNLNDLGKLVAGTFQKPELIGKRIGQSSCLASGKDLAEMFSKVSGKTIHYNCVSWETFASFGFPGADELAQMFEFWLRTYEKFCADRDFSAQEEIMGCQLQDSIEYISTFKNKLKFEEKAV